MRVVWDSRRRRSHPASYFTREDFVCVFVPPPGNRVPVSPVSPFFRLIMPRECLCSVRGRAVSSICTPLPFASVFSVTERLRRSPREWCGRAALDGAGAALYEIQCRSRPSLRSGSRGTLRCTECSKPFAMAISDMVCPKSARSTASSFGTSRVSRRFHTSSRCEQVVG